MKKNLFRISALLTMLIFLVSGCEKKDDPKPDPVIVSPGKRIVHFKIVDPAVTAVIDTIAKTITVTVPANTNVTALKTDISLAAGCSIAPASGASQNFTNPVVYTVTGPDNTTTAWTVRVNLPEVPGTGVVVDEDIAQSVTWTANKIYTINTDIEIVNSSVLTIEPGTVIKFGANGSLSVGYGSNATVLANGTEAKPIIFTSSALLPAAGAWKGIVFYENTLSNTVLEYCQILYAGSNPNYGAVSLLGCDITMKNCTIANSGSYGIYTTYSDPKGGFVAFENNTINSTVKNGVVLHAQKIGTLGTGNTFTNAKGIQIFGDYSSTTAQTWSNPGVPYIVTDELDIDGNLTIAPGTTFKFESNGWMGIGYYESTTFIAEGNSSTPITFTSTASTPGAGAWRGIVIYGETQTDSRMNFCIIEYAGSSPNYGAVSLLGCDITMENCTIANSGSYGIYTTYSNLKGGFVAFENNTINSTVKNGIVLHAQKIGALGTSNTFTNAKGLQIFGDYNNATAQTWSNLGIPYIVTDELDIDGNLTIAPGTTFKFESNGWMEIGYYESTTFTADGGSSAPITFTSSALTPGAGAWKGIVIHERTLTNSKMNFCIIEYAGTAPTNMGALLMTGAASINFTNNIIRHSAGYGINLSGDAGFQSFNNNTITNCANHVITMSHKRLPDLGTQNTLTAAAGKGIEIWNDARYGAPVTWKKQTADFYVKGSEINIDGDVTIEAGCTFRFINDAYYGFGYYDNTRIIAEGDATNKITFTSAASSPVAGAWRGLYFYGNVQPNSALSHCKFQYSGRSSKPAIFVSTSFPVNNTSITDFASTAAKYKTGGTVPPGAGNDFTWIAGSY